MTEIRTITPHVRTHARGTRENSANPKISIRFEETMFSEINEFAGNSRCSFGEAVRLLVGHAFAVLATEDNEDVV